MNPDSETRTMLQSTEMIAPPPRRAPARHRLSALARREIIAHAPHQALLPVLGIKARHDPARELAELRAYLGDAFDERCLSDPDLVDAELAAIGDEDLMYRRSRGYLYNLTAFAMGRTKDPYLAELESAVAPPVALLDYGCGIGSDGLCLMDAGYRVAFADFDNPSAEYLRWRLNHRGYRAPVYDLDAGPPPAGFSLAFAFDVIEHVADPFAMLAAMEACADRVLVNLLEPVPDDTDLHHHLPIPEILAHAAARGLQRYSLHYGRSHLILYEPGTNARPSAVMRALGAAAQLR